MVEKEMRGMRIKPKPAPSPLRSAAQFIRNHLGNDLIGVEIGVFKGENAEMMLEHMSIKHLYLVDRFLFDDTYKLSYADDMAPIKAEAERRIAPFDEKVEWILKDSLEAAPHISDGLDFVYIDGNHTYPYVKADIENFWPKLRKGGVLSGHDYSNLAGKVGVKKAVKEFVKNNKLDLHIGGSDWWIAKK